MSKSFTVLFKSSPYSNESVLSAIRIISSVIMKGHTVSFIVSGDGVCALYKDQKYSGLPDAEKLFAELIDNGLKAYLCGGCLGYRRVAKHDYIRGVEVVKAKTCVKIMEKSDILINL